MRLASALLIGVMLTVSTATAGETRLPTPSQILNGLGFSDTDQRAVFSGEIIAIDLPRVRDNQLKGAVAMRVPVANIERAADFFEGGRRLTVDVTVTEFGVLGPTSGEYDWRNVRFGPRDDGEVNKILTGRPASILNLSPDEAAALKNRLSPVTTELAGASEAVSGVYRDILIERYRSYLEDGLEGMPPYARGISRLASPAEEIRADLAAGSFSVLEPFPTFRQAILDFPRNQPAGVTSTFFWIRATVEGRPHYALAHQMTMRGDGYLLVYSRDFFSAHTYNTLQSTFLWLAGDGGLFGVHVNAGTTDEITGLFSGIARQVGKDRMKSDLINNFAEVRNQLTP